MEKLSDVLEELTKLEIFIHWPSTGTTRQEIENLLDEKFWEVGASGKIYNREIVMRVLEERTHKQNNEVWINKDFQCAEIAGDNFLLTYTLAQGERLTQRSSIWRKYENGFKLVYHQGTVVKNN
ncbi:MAG: DUF4440 domain-containing protein [Ignavibacteria bacterium]|nr:DUF4440 domain-containing protein [Ignavibacteria bacterium]